MNPVAAPASRSTGFVVSRRARTTIIGGRALDVWAFALPAVSFLEITLGGRLILSEVLALLLLPVLIRTRDRLQMPRWFIVLWGGWLLGQIVTDLAVGSAFVDYSRGWAKIFFTLTNFAAILALASTPRRARLFAVGLAVGGILGYAIFPENNIYAIGDPWKFALAFPVGFLVAAALSGPIGAQASWLAAGTLAAFGAVNLRLEFRALAGVALLSAVYLGLQALVSRSRHATHVSIARTAVGLLFSVAAALAIVQAYNAAAGRGLLGPTAQAQYLQQSGPLGVILGGRPEVLSSTQAVLDSPLLGHGSWANDPTYVYVLNQRLGSLGYQVVRPGDVGLIPTHSYLMGSWVEAGIMGGAFWFAVLTMAVWLLARLYVVRLSLSPLLVYSTTLLIWNILFSPYAGSGRLLGPYGIVLCLLGVRTLRADAVSAVRVREPSLPQRDASSATR